MGIQLLRRCKLNDQFLKNGAFTVALTALMLAACSGGASEQGSVNEAAPVQSVQTVDPLGMAIARSERGENAARDIYRNPQETLEFFGLAPNQTVVEIYPGGGWYADIIVPYVKATGGTYIAGGFPEGSNERFLAANQSFIEKFSDPDAPEQVTLVGFGKDTTSGLGAAGSADIVLSFRNVHNWMAGGWAEKAFVDFYDVLKSGGILGIVEHRLPATAEQDPRAPSGYVQEAYVKKLAADAGFEFVGSSEVNANPKDSADHPFGVWTLPPSNARKSRDGTRSIEGGSEYEAIGESDRMTLKFRKP